MSGYDLENKVTIVILIALISVYLYMLLSPSQPRLTQTPLNVVFKRDSKANFDAFMKGLREYQSFGYDDKTGNYSGWSDRNWESEKDAEWGEEGRHDDFFLDPNNAEEQQKQYDDDTNREVVTPSSEFLCVTGWLTIRSQVNYKYIWMHGNEQLWMGASATMDTPMHRKTFFVSPVHPNCSENGGWSLLREGDSKSYIQMISPNHTKSSNHSDAALAALTTSIYSSELWTIKLGTEDLQEAVNDPSYHFLLETEGFVLNREAMAFITIMAESDYPARGHSGGWNRNRPAGREFGAAVHFSLVNDSLVEEAIATEQREELDAQEQDERHIRLIQSFKNENNEKRVISFGLYGSKPKYTIGAIRNVELQKIYFPGWVCRFYVTSDVPQDVLDHLTSLGAEIMAIPSGMGYTSGMFWRFFVASDVGVDRYIIRDSDSRLNARDRYGRFFITAKVWKTTKLMM
jgi:hypothetical protein